MYNFSQKNLSCEHKVVGIRLSTAPCGKYDSHSQKCLWEMQFSFKVYLLQEDLLLCRGSFCACLSFCKWNCLPSNHGRGRDFICLKINFFIHSLFIYWLLDGKDGPAVFSLWLVTSLLITVYFSGSEDTSKPSQAKPLYNTLKGKNLCHLESLQSHYFLR